MRLLVTGGMGFIGSNFVRYMLESHKDVEVINLDALSYGSNPANLADLKDDPRYRFVHGDICDKDLVQRLVRDADVIVNFAAETHVDRSISNPEAFIRSNTLGTFTLLEAARIADVSFVQISTDEVYGTAPSGVSFSEESTLKPSSPYSASKAAADMFVLAYHRTYGLRATITRCTNNFGPYQFPEKLIPKTIIRALKDLPIPVYGSGKQVRDWIYVLDHCEAIDLVIHKGKPGEIYNISSGNEIEVLRVVELILQLLNKPRSLIMHVEDRPGEDLRYSLDSSKIREELGWRPKHSFEEALAETVRWYVQNEWWWRPLATDKVLHPTPWRLKWD